MITQMDDSLRSAFERSEERNAPILWQVFIVGASDTLSVRTPIVNSRETIHSAATDDWDAK